MNCACFYNCQYDQYGSTLTSYHDENCIIGVGQKKCTLLPLQVQPLQPPQLPPQQSRVTVKRRKSHAVSHLKMKRRKQKIEQVVRRNQRLCHLIQWNAYVVNSLLQAAIDSGNSHNHVAPTTATTVAKPIISHTNSCHHTNSANQNHYDCDNTANCNCTTTPKETPIEMPSSARTPESSFQESIDMDKSLTPDQFTSGPVKVGVIPSPTRMPNVCKIVIRSPSSRLTSPPHHLSTPEVYSSSVRCDMTSSSHYYPSPVQYYTPTNYSDYQITTGPYAWNHRPMSRTNGPWVNSFHSQN